MRSAVDALVRLANQQRELVAQACVSMAADLGEAPPPLSDPPTDEQLSEACSLARAAVATAMEQAGCSSIEITAGECTPDQAAQASCQEACAGAEACLTCCDEVAPYQVTCTLSTVTVDTPDVTLQTTLEENLPAVYLVVVQCELLLDLSLLVAEQSVGVLGLAASTPPCDEEYGAEVMNLFTEAVDASVSVSVLVDVSAELFGSLNCSGSAP